MIHKLAVCMLIGTAVLMATPYGCRCTHRLWYYIQNCVLYLHFYRQFN